MLPRGLGPLSPPGALKALGPPGALKTLAPRTSPKEEKVEKKKKKKKKSRSASKPASLPAESKNAVVVAAATASYVQDKNPTNDDDDYNDDDFDEDENNISHHSSNAGRSSTHDEESPQRSHASYSFQKKRQRIHPVQRLSSQVQARLAALDRAEGGAVSLADACLGDYGCRAVAERLKESSATSLDLRGNQIKGEGALALAASLGASRSLRSLSLEWNSLGLFPEGFRALASCLSASNSTLTSIDLRNNRLTADAGTALSSALRTNRSLNTLDLRWNSLGELGCRSLSQALEQNSTLTTLHMSGNNASESTLKSIRTSIERNRGQNINVRDALSENNSRYPSSTGTGGQGDYQKFGTTSSAAPLSLESSAPMAAAQGGVPSSSSSSSSSSLTNNTRLDPESLEGATSIIETLERALRLQRAEAQQMQTKLESEIVAHTRSREEASVSTSETEAMEERHQMRTLELKNEIDRMIRERSDLVQTQKVKMEDLNLATVALSRSNYDMEAKVRSLNEQLSTSREELRQERLKTSDLNDRVEELQRSSQSLSSEIDMMRSAHEQVRKECLVSFFFFFQFFFFH